MSMSHHHQSPFLVVDAHPEVAFRQRLGFPHLHTKWGRPCSSSRRFQSSVFLCFRLDSSHTLSSSRCSSRFDNPSILSNSFLPRLPGQSPVRFICQRSLPAVSLPHHFSFPLFYNGNERFDCVLFVAPSLFFLVVSFVSFRRGELP